MKKLITYYLKPFYGRMAMGFTIKFTGTIMDLFLPWILAYMIDTVIPRDDAGQIIPWGFCMLICSILAVSGNVIANRMASRVASEATEDIRHDLFEKVMYLTSHDVDGWTKPSLISRLTSDTYNVHQMVGRIQRLGIRAPILLVGGIMITMTLDPVLSGILICIMPILAVIMFQVSKRSVPLYTGLQEAMDRFVRLVREDIAGIRVIKALSKDKFERSRFNEINQEVVEREKKAGMVMAVINPSMNVLLNMGLVLVIIAGALRVNQGTGEVGKILAFMTYFTIILNAMLSISKMFVIFSKAEASANRIAKVLEVEDERDLHGIVWEEKEPDETVESQGQVTDSRPYIEFEHVTFSYNKVEANLSNISFRIKKGETLGIIGETGSGKTTVANLLMRFYEVDEGRILIDGRNVKDLDPGSLRKHFGVVFQNDTIFENTIFENVRLGRDLTEEETRDALFYARAREFVEERDGQMQEKLDIKGANLSGGQKQRVLIARALADHPDILILDDSSSALDYKTDADLRTEIKEHFKETTLVIIAQRISSIMHADHILVLEEGEMIGYGTHKELIESCDIYREISQSQMGI